jgi:AraC family transcriptional regulator
MLEMMADASRCRMKIFRGTKAPWLEQATIIVRERLSERLTLSGIAAAVGVHPVYLATMFRQRYGSSVGEYLRQSRIEFACRKLSTTDAPLSDVALSAGFSHQSHFARTFKRLTGLTPAQYRSIFRSP